MVGVRGSVFGNRGRAGESREPNPENPIPSFAPTNPAAVKAAPDQADPYCKRGIVFERMGEYDLALADLERALARDPNLADALLRGDLPDAAGCGAGVSSAEVTDDVDAVIEALP